MLLRMSFIYCSVCFFLLLNGKVAENIYIRKEKMN